LIVVAMTLGLLASSMTGVPSAWWPLVVLAQAFLSFVCCVINHNHTHRATFAWEPANRALGIALSWCRGHTSATVVVPHNLNHHVYAAEALDWSRPELAGSGWGAVRLLRYLFVSSVEMARKRAEPGAPKLTGLAARRLKVERAALVALALFGLAWDWKAFLVLWALPWFLAIEGLLAVNLLQHDGCDPAETRTASRNFVGRMANWLLFNNGYHTAHHLRPAAHWTDLPRIHRALGVTSALDEPSLLGFFARAYVLGVGVPASGERSRWRRPSFQTE
jgi:beta-carotene hydroxylase